jgi:hypothetical protein
MGVTGPAESLFTKRNGLRVLSEIEEIARRTPWTLRKSRKTGREESPIASLMALKLPLLPYLSRHATQRKPVYRTKWPPCFE